MAKKLLNAILFIAIITTLTACIDNKEVTIELDFDELTLIEGETFQLEPSTNDEEGLIFSVNTAGIVSINESGTITARTEGEVIVTIKSKEDNDVTITLTVFVRKEIMLVSNVLEINVTEEDTHQLIITSNDGYDFEVTNTEIVVVDDSGLITAKKEGSTTILVTSTYDPDVSITITVNVSKLIAINVLKDQYVLIIGDTEQLNVSSNDGLDYVSGDNSIVTVSETGQLEAIGFGQTTVRVTSTYDDTISELVNVQVYKYTETIEINGTDYMLNGMTSTMTISSSPVGSFPEVLWESSDETVLEVDEFGTVTAVGPGSANIIAKSTLDETIADSFEVTVVNILVVDGSKQTGDTYDLDGLILEFGEQLFSTISAAVSSAEPSTMIYVADGTYSEAFTIDKDGITLQGISDGAMITNIITVNSNDVTIEHLVFEGNGTILNTVDFSNFTFRDNIVQNLNHSEASFMTMTGVTGILIEENVFSTFGVPAIEILDFAGGLIEVQHNTFENVVTAISIQADREYAITTEIKLFWNTINSVATAFDINLIYTSGTELDITKIARFNSVAAYQDAVLTNVDSTFDFTLNYWGDTTYDLADFTNVDEYYLAGSYSAVEAIPTEAQYSTELPILILVDNPILEIMVGETHVFEYTILPYELQDAPVKFITGDPLLVLVQQDGTISPLSSGETYIQIRSAIVSTIRVQTNFSIITTPGIEITSSQQYSDVIIGDSIDLDVELFPYTIFGESVTFSSNNEVVATIDQDGIVTTLSEGIVTFRATLDSDSSVYQDYTIFVHTSLNSANLLDYLTMQQITYSEIHSWIAYGFAYNYNDTIAESVSRYYFDTIEINDSKIVPVYYAIRPGELMDPGYDDFNDDNIYWVVVHDTASTATGSNALAHANYLYNNAVAENPLWVSWHYTIDDHDVYQHLPEIERGFHAGDGSTNPGEGSYLGGGNRNGIGIEMSVNDDGDMMRTWQRTAKLVTDILVRNSMPRSQQKYHNDFSGKDCPNTLRNAGLIPLFEQFVDVEYYVATNHPDAEITFTSHNPEYLDNHGRVIVIPARAVTVSYTITVTEDGVTQSRTFYTYIPGTVR